MFLQHMVDKELRRDLEDSLGQLGIPEITPGTVESVECSQNTRSLEQWLSTFLIPRHFHTVLHVVLTPPQPQNYSHCYCITVDI